jgi:hypothetical protein
MAIYENPKYYKGPPLQQITARAVDSKTWQAGQFCKRTGSGVVPCGKQSTKIHGVFAQTQVVATSSSDVIVDLIPSAETQFIVYAAATTAGVGAVAGPVNIGKNLGLGVNSCICTAGISSQTDGTASLHVEDVYRNKDRYSGIMNDTSTSPGAFIVSVRSSFLS